MKFFERDLCKKLVELGCVSESQFFHVGYEGTVLYGQLPMISINTIASKAPNSIVAFTTYDFIAPTEQANENLIFLDVF